MSPVYRLNDQSAGRAWNTGRSGGERGEGERGGGRRGWGERREGERIEGEGVKKGCESMKEGTYTRG